MHSIDMIGSGDSVGQADARILDTTDAWVQDGPVATCELAEDDDRYRRELAEEAILKADNFDPVHLELRADIVTRRASDIAMDGPYAAAFAEAACWSHRSLQSMVTELQALMTDLHDGCDSEVAARRIASLIGQPNRDV